MREVADAYHPSSEALPLVCSFMAGETLHPILLALHPRPTYTTPSGGTLHPTPSSILPPPSSNSPRPSFNLLPPTLTVRITSYLRTVPYPGTVGEKSMKNQWSLVSYAYEKSKPLIAAHNYTAIMRTRTDVFFTRRYGMAVVWYGMVWYGIV